MNNLKCHCLTLHSKPARQVVLQSGAKVKYRVELMARVDHKTQKRELSGDVRMLVVSWSGYHDTQHTLYNVLYMEASVYKCTTHT